MTNAFDWKGKPSIVANDMKFRAHKNGKSRSQIATEVVQKAYDKGSNVGTIFINEKSDLGTTEAFNRIHRRKK